MKLKKYFLWGILVLFIIGSLFHFLYDLLNNNFFIGLLSPINESIWEHTKLVFIPYILYYVIIYIKNKNIINKDKWFTSLLVGVILGIILIPTIYYAYTGALGFKSLIIDILILLIVNIITQLISFHIYNYIKKPLNTNFVFIILFILFIVYIIFTIYPPNLPIFLS